MKPAVLVLTFDYGGHRSLAYATKDAIEEYYPDKFAIHVENVAPSFLLSFHHFFTTGIPEAWSFVFSSSNLTPHLANEFFALLSYSKIKKIIHHYKPVLVISNFCCYSTALRRIRRKHHFSFALMVADPFSLHQSWFEAKDANSFIVTTQEAAELAQKAGVAKDKILVVGWPIRRQFSQKKSLSAIRQKLGFKKDIFTVFLGGSVSGGRILPCLKLIAKAVQEPMQLIVICGNNTGLKRQITAINFPPQVSIRTFGFVKDLSDLMALSNLVMGKAGPNILFEAIMLGKPILTTGSLAAQEAGNLHFIQQKQIGWVIHDPKKAVAKLVDLKSHPALLGETVKRIEAIGPEFRFNAQLLAKTLIDSL